MNKILKKYIKNKIKNYQWLIIKKNINNIDFSFFDLFQKYQMLEETIEIIINKNYKINLEEIVRNQILSESFIEKTKKKFDKN